jgi:hypothetical protein
MPRRDPDDRRLMRRLTLFILCLVFAPAASRADTWMRVREHTDASYHHGTVDQAVDSESEIWIGGGRIASIDKDRRYIIDLTAGRVIVVEKADTAYVETTLPFSLSVILPEEVRPRAAMFQVTGEVTRLEGTKMIGGRECEGWMVHSWINYLESRFDETERTTWVTKDLPADGKALETYYDVVWRMNNFSEELVAALRGMGGCELMTESVTYSEGQAIKASSEIVEIAEKDPPPGIYDIPEGYRKKEFIRVGG